MNLDENFATSLKKFDTGDLIFFSGNNPIEIAIKFFTGCNMTHVGLIIKENDILYVWESDIGQKHREGPRIITLDDKLKYWHGFHNIAWKKYIPEDSVTGISKRPSANQVLRIVDKYVNLPFNDNLYEWFFNLNSNKNNIPESLFCSSLVAITLIELGILNKKMHPITWWSPAQFLRDFQTSRGKYDQPLFFVY